MTPFNNKKNKRKISYSYLIILMLIVLIVSVIYTGISAILSESRQVRNNYELLRLAESVDDTLMEVNADYSDFMLTGEDIKLEKFNRHKKQLDKLIGKGKQLVTGEGQQATRWSKVAELMTRWEQQVVQPEIAVRQQIEQSDIALTHFETLSSRLVGKAIFDDIRGLLSALHDKFEERSNEEGKALIDLITLSLVNMETGQRGFLLSGAEESLEPFEEGKKRVTVQLELVRSHAVSGNVNASDIDALERRIGDWLRKAAIPEIQARRELNNKSVSNEDLTTMLAGGLTQQYIGNVRDLLKEIIIDEELTLNTRKVEEASTDLFIKIAIVLGILVLFMVLMLGFMRTQAFKLVNYRSKLEHLAHYDTLTNLPNRVLLANQLSQSMAQCRRRKQSLAVAFMDLDGFKAINDNHGHKVGDELLVAVSQRMKNSLREGDMLARIGGDEFIAVMVDLSGPHDSEPALQRLLDAAAKPVIIGDDVLNVTTSIGVNFYPEDSSDAEQLMRHADQAMYLAKQAGKNQFYIFDTKKDSAYKALGETIGQIRSALEQEHFVLHYQPQVNMCTGDVIGVEALIRWQHPERGLIPPLEFLPAIESHNLSIKLGEWVISSALAQIKQWHDDGLSFTISVNISAYQLTQSDFPERLALLLHQHADVDSNLLELEILETAALSDITQVSDVMNACHKLGVRFALDDFGTGYSSLTYLRRLPAQQVKIDQSFVRDMLEDPDDLAIIKGVVGLANAFKRDVIAEGVETRAHGKALLALGCEQAQGYGIARPMPAGDIHPWVQTWQQTQSWQS